MIIDRKKIISLIYARILYTISVDLDGSDVKEQGSYKRENACSLK